MNTKINSRAIAAKIINKVISENIPIKEAIVQTKIPIEQTAFVKEICFGVCRYYYSLDLIVSTLITKPIKSKDEIVKFLIIIGIYQLKYLSTKNYAAISETVNAAGVLKKPWAKGLINATLRNFEREFDDSKFNNDPEYIYSHPKWLIDKITYLYPNNYKDILLNNNAKPPLSIRVNIQNTTVDKYLDLLKQNSISFTKISEYIFTLNKAIPTEKIPGFKEGLVSIQDSNAALAPYFLKINDKLNILDACAAPGGKTCAILEQHPTSKVLAIEKYIKRSELIKHNLERLKLNCSVKIADASDIKSWWDNKPFDRILLDAPCSATGIIRRQPDVKIHRIEKDLTELVKLQSKLLQALWQTLSPGGYLLYDTCSVINDENWVQMQNFINNNTDANYIHLETDIQCDFKPPLGIQLLPGENQGDGFYYCLLQKS